VHDKLTTVVTRLPLFHLVYLFLLSRRSPLSTLLYPPGMLTRTQASRPRPGPRTQHARPRLGPRTCLFLTQRTEPRTSAYEPTSYILPTPPKSVVNVICQKFRSITNTETRKHVQYIIISSVCKFYLCIIHHSSSSVQFWSINLSYVALNNITHKQKCWFQEDQSFQHRVGHACSIWTHEQCTLREHTFHRCRR